MTGNEMTSDLQRSNSSKKRKLLTISTKENYNRLDNELELGLS